MYFLESKRIGLRELKLTDIDGNYSNWFNDEKVCQYNSHHRFVMLKNGLVNYVQGQSSNSIILAIEVKEEKKHIGNISLQSINLIDRNAEIAFIIGERDYWGKGYGTEAAMLLIMHGFNELGLYRIYFGTAADNIGMQKLGEKLGFKKEGIRRKALFKHNEYKDIYEYGLLKDEYVFKEGG